MPKPSPQIAMKDPRTAKVIEIKRKPPVWSVKVGARYVTGFSGTDARQRAVAFAAANFVEFEIVEKPVPKREQLSRRGPSKKAGLSKPT
jgi:hypothetical protein